MHEKYINESGKKIKKHFNDEIKKLCLKKHKNCLYIYRGNVCKISEVNERALELSKENETKKRVPKLVAKQTQLQ